MNTGLPRAAKSQHTSPPDEIMLDDIWAEEKKSPKSRPRPMTEPESMLDSDEHLGT